MLKFLTKSRDLVAESDALPGRDEPIPVPEKNIVLGTPLLPPFPEGIEVVQLGIILAVFPLLALLRRRAPLAGLSATGLIAACVCAAGLVWFVQRSFQL